jgi:cytoskeletal protein RodZ
MSADPNPDLQRLGTCLHQARLREGISLEDLAQRLHMGREQLQSLEQADATGLPEPVFVIAQARRVASALGVNIDSEIQALRRSHAEAVTQPAVTPPALAAEPTPIAARAARREPRQRQGSGRACNSVGTLGLWLAGLALLGAGALAVWRILPVAEEQAQQAAAGSPTPPASPSSAAPSSPSALTIRTSQPSWLEVRTVAGTNLYRGTLVGEQVFPYQGDLLVLAGRPDLVKVEEPGGVPRRLGSINQVRWQRFRAPEP